MDWQILKGGIGEGKRIPVDGGFETFKRVRFIVEGRIHTLEVSNEDFEQGRLFELVKAEAEKIIASYGSPKK